MTHFASHRPVSSACACALALSAITSVLLIACTSSDNPQPQSDAGGGADATTRADATALADGTAPDDASTTNDASAAPDAGPVTRDPYRHQWPVTAERPATSSYVVDADAGVVADTVTGLVWTRALLVQEQTTFDAGGGPGSVNVNDRDVARAACAGATVNGVGGFRLPTMVELMTIIDFDKLDWNDPKAFTDTAYGDVYWADGDDVAPLAYDNHYPPWHFIAYPFAPKGPWASASIRCVHAPYPVSAHAQPVPAGRFVVHGPTAIDTVTKLEWQIGTATTQTYAAAATYCATLDKSDAGVDAGANPWRLPTLKEMASTWSEADGGPEPSVFGPTNGGGYLWTSSLYWGNSVGQGPNIRFTWFPSGSTGPKYFSWDANQSISDTRCVRTVP